MKDLKLDPITGDLAILNGDFVIDESWEQSIFTLLKTAKNEFKEFPSFGADLDRKLHELASDKDLENYLKTAFEIDNYKNVEIKVTDGNIEIQNLQR